MDGGDGQTCRCLCKRTDSQLVARKQAMTDATPHVMIPQRFLHWAGHFRGLLGWLQWRKLTGSTSRISSSKRNKIWFVSKGVFDVQDKFDK
jgi:hypothetical protein